MSKNPGSGIERLEAAVGLAFGEDAASTPRRLVVAVSGGPDSLALLYALNRRKAELGIELYGAHLDHGLRGRASAEDATFVGRVFDELGLEHTIETADVEGRRAAGKLSVEEAARDARYDFLAAVAHTQRADAVALAHTADDQAETVLMHIIRGAGLTGLRGMEASSSRSFRGREYALIRPLLKVSRQETEGYCAALGLQPRRDESNLSTAFWRNRVRLELIPQLREHNPAVTDALLRLSQSAARDLEFIEGEVDRVWPGVARQEGGSVVLDRDGCRSLPSALRYHVLRRAVGVVRGTLDDVSQSHIGEMDRLMRGPAGTSIDLPGAVRFTVEYDRVRIQLTAVVTAVAPVLGGPHRLAVPGETLVPGWRVAVAALNCAPPPDAVGDGEPGGRDVTVALLDADALGAHLTVRSRRPGDRFQPLGMGGTKKLQDFMVDSRVPRAGRDRIPILAAGRGIAWVVGYRIAHWARITEDTGRVLEIRFEPR